MKIKDALETIESKARQYGEEVSSQERIIILSEVINRDFSQIISDKEQELSETQKIKLKSVLQELFERSRPLEKITGRAFFYGLELFVDENVLSPRPETEILVEKALMYIDKETLAKPKVLDLGTGSGCISIAIANHCPGVHITAVDVSEAALDVAKRNVSTYSMNDRIDVIRSDLFSEVIDRDYDIIVANPPYISEDEFKSLDPRVLYHDPRCALYGGRDGLDFYRRIFASAFSYLKKGGAIFVEAGADQADKIMELIDERYIKVEVFLDHGYNERVIFVRTL
jgi:release factor glutamine methyltransferase